MANERLLSTLLLLLLLRLTASLLLSGAAAQQQKQPLPNLVIFGDSLSDEGNLFSITSGAIPSPSHYPSNGSVSDGRLWPSQLSELVAAASPPPQLNYATAGATACEDHSTFAIVPSLQDQVDSFLSGVPPPYVTSAAAAPNNKTAAAAATEEGPSGHDIYIIQLAGLNDYWGTLRAPGNLDPRLSTLPARVSACLRASAKRLLQQQPPPAALVMFNVAPRVTRLPYVQALVPQALGQRMLLDAVDRQNANLRELTEGLQQQFRDTRILIYDVANITSRVYEHPERYGIADTTGTCIEYTRPPAASPLDVLLLPVAAVCDDPSSYFWYDLLHPTSAVHAAIAADLHAFLTLEKLLDANK